MKLVQRTVELIADPFTELMTDEEERDGFYETTKIVVTSAHARKMKLLPAGELVYLLVVDQLTDRVLHLGKQEDGVINAIVEPDYTARHRAEMSA